ncbi:MAG TPA: class I SAM-dependent methyltransferase [Acidobacteriaceae bacterium]|jgi:ubiquinone/menaquinone biosynthesis C-methylase UbiE
MSACANFGRLAPLYRWMEYFSFGPYLQQCRVLRLDTMATCRNALIYGDGDGRFLARLAKRVPRMQITAVDVSREMLHHAAQRLPAKARVRFLHADALACEPAAFPEAPFDLIVSHFFLDCFDEEELRMLLARVNAAAADSAIWVVSDFAIPRQAIARQAGIFIVHGLYLVFGLLTGLRTRRLPDHGRVMRESGWVFEDRRNLLMGLLLSERWRRNASS